MHHDHHRVLPLRRHLANAAFATAAVALNTLIAPVAHAQTPALNFSGEGPNGTNTTSTRGYAFDVTGAGFTVTYLSIYDAGSNGLAESHDVGLWDPAGNLLASVTVPSGAVAPLDATGKFREVGIAPVFLPAGTAYTVGALFLISSQDFQAIQWSSSTTAPNIAFVESRFINNGIASLTQPTDTNNLIPNGFVGGSFGGTPSIIAAAPEPASLALLALAAMPLMGGLVRRR